jgi:hypothetical protein
LQRVGGQLIGLVLSGLGLTGFAAWFFLGQETLPAIALLPPGGLLGTGIALIVWSRGIEGVPDADLIPHASLPEQDPRRREPISVRQARWAWALSAWLLWTTTWSILAWFSQGAAPGLLRMAVFLAATLPATAWGARWLERANGESRWPAL